MILARRIHLENSLDNKIKILVVEDDDLTRKMLERMLLLKDYDVECAQNGEEGWEKFREAKHKFNLILVDLRMPKLSGSDLITRINKVAQDIPKIIISGQGDMDDALTAIEQDVFFYVKKPIQDITEFYHIVDRALEKDRLLRENLRYQEELTQPAVTGCCKEAYTGTCRYQGSAEFLF